MSTINIGGQERNLRDATPQWIHEQIDPRHGAGGNPCVVVTIKLDDIDIALSTPNCHMSGGGGRAPNRKEQSIFDLWNKLHLNGSDFSVGNVIAFVQQVLRLI